MSSGSSSTWLGHVVLLEPAPTSISSVPYLEADLALWARGAIVGGARVLGIAVGEATAR
jgi:hypothetical protein